MRVLPELGKPTRTAKSTVKGDAALSQRINSQAQGLQK